MLKNCCVFLLLGTESCSKLSILIGAKWTRHKEGWLSTNLQIIFWQVSTSHFIFWINRIINKCGLWVITDPPSVMARVHWKQCFCRYSKLPCLERNTRVNFSFIKNGKSLLLYSFKANVLTNWHEKARICKLQNHSLAVLRIQIFSWAFHTRFLKASLINVFEAPSIFAVP